MRKLCLSLTLCSLAPACSPPANVGRAPLQSAIEQPLLAIHNRTRAAFGSPTLRWDPVLAAGAQAYARQLALVGRLQHSPRQMRPGQGENLSLGTRGAYPIEAMAGGWAAERRLFRPGRFPAVSRTGNWADTGHFTAMVWPTTTRLGCGLASAGRWDVLVCRYAPAGNVDGVFLAPR